jgi:hypothetical protein
MPRRITRVTKTSKGNKTGAALKFVASLFFLYVVLAGLHSGMWGVYASGSIWTPILLPVALLGSIALFFSTLAEMVRPEMCMGGKLVAVVSFSLVALTVGPLGSAALWITIVGFLIGWAGIAAEKM